MQLRAPGASVRFGFRTIGLESIIAIVHPENTASQHVVWKSLECRFVDRNRYFGMELLPVLIGPRVLWRAGCRGRGTRRVKRHLAHGRYGSLDAQTDAPRSVSASAAVARG